MNDDRVKKEIAAEVARQVLETIKLEVIPAVQESIQKTVNGKIDRMQIQNSLMEQKLDEHMAYNKPIVDLIEGSIVAKKIVLWITSLILAVGAVVTMIKNI
jgi:hypothetical protein